MTTSTEKAVLTDKDTLKEVIDCLSQHISIKTQGAFNHTYLLNILRGAASNTDSRENTTKKLKKSGYGKNVKYPDRQI
ncbi:MAG: hypothetical protein QNJ72_35830 [Pleurocapsa sp. MO_226.B13]|nr:hypothetical protein [Pleurocapsa sp. MO_226.B13]